MPKEKIKEVDTVFVPHNEKKAKSSIPSGSVNPDISKMDWQTMKSIAWMSLILLYM